VDLSELHGQVGRQLARDDHRYTAGRRALVEVLARANRPVTLPEITDGTTDLAQSSAYRNLDVLERSGIIRRINLGGDHSLFELAEPLIGHHHHLACLQCGLVEDIHLDDELEVMIDRGLAKAAQRLGFAPRHHSLDLHGYCAACCSPPT